VRDLKDATFIRSGRAYDCAAAAEHMQLKWSNAGDRTKTARDFVRDCASTSSQTGQPYLIRFKDGRETKSADFLNQQLDPLEHPTTRPADGL
jgi:hypothetical protein